MSSSSKVCRVLVTRALALSQSTPSKLTSAFRPLTVIQNDVVLHNRMFPVSIRSYAVATPIPKSKVDEVTSRVMKCVGNCPKIIADKMTLDTHFVNDLGLDTDDQMEIIMAIEDRFEFEIPNDEAKKLFSPNDIIKYIMGNKIVSEYDLTSDPHP